MSIFDIQDSLFDMEETKEKVEINENKDIHFLQQQDKKGKEFCKKSKCVIL
jgi:hypothetical protein